MTMPDKNHLRAPVQPHGAEVIRPRKKIILCFDGTGNKFKGNDGDTNILKIFRMLDRSGSEQFHYYQPGIGTYITNGTLSRVHVYSRVKSWCQKAMDAAFGTSFDQHVIGGYKFLMRYYSPGDDIYLFGFSRGAYTARFLAEMLDHVGLVSQGNEEMVLFAWKTFSNWQQRQDVGWGQKKEDMYEYMKAFRETFARPVRRIRFLGLFDTVNSVPRFEDAWLKRSKGFPYTARSTARVIRHAVGIDERRAKFRQDLVEKASPSVARHRSFKSEKLFREAMRSMGVHIEPNSKESKPDANGHQVYDCSSAPHHERFSGSHERLPMRTPTPGPGDQEGAASLNVHAELGSDDIDEEEQNIEEVWFPGAHGDIGGGWDLPNDEEPLSHGPLIWMIREARRAGLVFDKQRMKDHNCWLEEFDMEESSNQTQAPVPVIEVSVETTTSPDAITTSNRPTTNGIANKMANGANGVTATNSASSPCEPEPKDPRTYLLDSYTRSKIHDCLCWPSGGLTLMGTLGWKTMEYLPFRRMDLQPDGSWKPIVWPLPRGEVRDIPENVRVHNSVIRRMQADPGYRPGNLLIGGGGRGVRKAPDHVGIGEWVVLREEGSLVGEVLVKKANWDKENMGANEKEGGDKIVR